MGSSCGDSGTRWSILWASSKLCKQNYTVINVLDSLETRSSYCQWKWTDTQCRWGNVLEIDPLWVEFWRNFRPNRRTLFWENSFSGKILGQAYGGWGPNCWKRSWSYKWHTCFFLDFNIFSQFLLSFINPFTLSLTLPLTYSINRYY